MRDSGCIVVDIRRHRNAKPRCSVCGKVMHGTIKEIDRQWRHHDILRFQCFLSAKIREARCATHGRRVERVPWASSRSHHSHEFDRRVASLAQVADKSAATRMFRVTWRTVGRMVSRVVQRHLPKNLFRNVTRISVDETSYKRGHRYLTIVTCLRRGIVIWIGEGKSAATLNKFFEEFGKTRCSKLQVVTMDMSEAYLNSVRAHAPKAEIVYDRFHVVQLLLNAVDEIRRDEVRKLEGADRQKIKGTRFSLLRNPERYTSRDQMMIRSILRSNRRIARAWELRVDFEQLWDCEDEYSARQFALRWTRSALLSRQAPLRRFAKTIRKHLEGILGFFRHGGLTNAVQEGMNNKIKLIIHRAFGFRSISALIAMIHLCCSGIQLI